MRWAVVIPTLNEADQIADAVRSAREAGAHEVVVADGGSDDATADLAQQAGAQVHLSPPGRGLQMTAGAAACSGDALLFLHADTRLPADALALAARELDEGAVGGAFRLRFDQQSWVLRAYAAATRVPWHRIAFGDRAHFCTRAAFEQIGGFPDIGAFEDLELVRRLRGVGRFAFVPAAVTTSARRFRRNGTLGQQLLNLRLWTAYQLGADPDRLAERYRYDEARGR
jgi:rSAM/selenodomain-associated transferase 2